MHRIDENTYIDDSLITCAEYQLFIDEMSGPGKYRQPDHWTTNYFPSGDGHQPILGVRSLDAEAFCVWLTQHTLHEWHYRLPIAQEAATYPLRPYKQTPLGYWLLGSSRFAWNHPIPTNPRNLTYNNHPNLDLDIKRALAHDSNHNHDRELDLNRTRARIRDLDLDNVRARTHTSFRIMARTHTMGNILDYLLDLDREITQTHLRALERILDRALDLDRDLAQVLNQNRDLTRTDHTLHSLDIASKRAYDLIKARKIAVTRAETPTRPRPQKYSGNMIRRLIQRSFHTLAPTARRILSFYNPEVTGFRDLDRKIARNLVGDITRTLDHVLYIYVDILTLHERIAGRSPAFEGIRIVKERVK
jgi:hypothetical protein